MLAGSIYAQNTGKTDKNDKHRKVTIKVVEKKNGKEKIIDTTFTDVSRAEIDKFLKDNDISTPEAPESPGKEPSAPPAPPTPPAAPKKIKKVIIIDEDDKKTSIDINEDLEKEIIINEPGNEESKIIIKRFDSDMEDFEKSMEKFAKEFGADMDIVFDDDNFVFKLADPSATDIDEEVIINEDGKTQKMIIIKKNGCDDKKEGEKTKVKKETKTFSYIFSDSDEGPLKVFPNPSNGKFTLKFNAEEKDNYMLSVNDSNGKTVWKEKLNNHSGEYSKEIDISKNGKGMYIVEVRSEHIKIKEKVVVE